jgi:hypothetical protein
LRGGGMNPEISHDDCLDLLARPSTQNILKKLGFEYSDRGLAEYRKARPNLVPILVRAIVDELKSNPIFPKKYRDKAPTVGVFISKQADDFILRDIDKPSVVAEHIFSDPEAAARGYIRKILDSYWLQPDNESTSTMLKSLNRNWMRKN